MTITCDHCGIKARVLRNGAYSAHYYTNYRGRVRCEKSGTRFPIHECCEFEANQYGKQGTVTEWKALCNCTRIFLAPDYAAAELAWKQHRDEELANASR